MIQLFKRIVNITVTIKFWIKLYYIMIESQPCLSSHSLQLDIIGFGFVLQNRGEARYVNIFTHCVTYTWTDRLNSSIYPNHVASSIAATHVNIFIFKNSVILIALRSLKPVYNDFQCVCTILKICFSSC